MDKQSTVSKKKLSEKINDADAGTRERILSAASRLLATKCMHSFSIRDISSEAGVNSALISYHFGGKEQLYAEVLKNNFDSFRANVIANFVAGTDLKASLRNACMAFFKFNKENPYWLMLYMRELTNHSASYAAIVVPCMDEAGQKLTEMIQAGVDSGAFNATFSARHASFAMVGMINYFFLIQPILKTLQCKEGEQIEEYADFVTDLLLHGVVAK
jgi:TetR/AcrR family transcriptional regulator